MQWYVASCQQQELKGFSGAEKVYFPVLVLTVLLNFFGILFSGFAVVRLKETLYVNKKGDDISPLTPFAHSRTHKPYETH